MHDHMQTSLLAFESHASFFPLTQNAGRDPPRCYDARALLLSNVAKQSQLLPDSEDVGDQDL